MKKATLLIKNLRTMYTMQENDKECCGTCFIAIHHDEIIDLGTHDFTHHIDKDTRMIDGTNHIAVPSFIEPGTTMHKEKNSMREYDEFFMRYMHNGTLNIQLDHPIVDVLYKNYHYEILHQPPKDTHFTIVNVIQQMKHEKLLCTKDFCISCKDDAIALQNQMLAAQLLAMKEGIAPYELLKALTIHPAHYLGLDDRGVLKIGARANILVLSSKDLHAFFYSLDQNQIAHIIHKGVRIYPNLII